MLLLKTSFVDLKTVEGEICETFREACQRPGLLEDDKTMGQYIVGSVPHMISISAKKSFCCNNNNLRAIESACTLGQVQRILKRRYCKGATKA
jgi:hypothetical protein